MKFYINSVGSVTTALLLLSACDEPADLVEDSGEAEAVQSELDGERQEPPVAETEVEAFARVRGLPLEEATRRLARQVLAPDLETSVRLALGESFGGVWIGEDDLIKVGVTVLNVDSARVVRRAAEEVGLADGEYQAVAVRHAMAEIERANDFLADRLIELATEDGPGLLAGLRTDINAVELQVPEGTELTGPQERLIADAKAQLGELLVVSEYTGRAEVLACKYPYCDPPLRGGIGIWNGYSSCTAAFVAASKTDGKLYQFTAGHCGAKAAGNWYTRFSDGSVHAIGAVWNRVWGGSGDMGILKINNVAGWKPAAQIRVSGNSAYSISADKSSVIGMTICVSGSHYGHSSCGKVTQLGVTVTYTNGPTVKGLGRASFCAIPGDSGAPVYASHVAYGLLSGKADPCDSFYQGIRAAEEALNVNVLH